MADSRNSPNLAWSERVVGRAIGVDVERDIAVVDYSSKKGFGD